MTDQPTDTGSGFAPSQPPATLPPELASTSTRASVVIFAALSIFLLLSCFACVALNLALVRWHNVRMSLRRILRADAEQMTSEVSVVSLHSSGVMLPSLPGEAPGAVILHRSDSDEAGAIPASRAPISAGARGRARAATKPAKSPPGICTLTAR